MNELVKIQIGTIVYPGFKSFEAIGPMTVFTCANRAARSRGLNVQYDLQVFSDVDAHVTSDTLMGLQASTLLTSPLHTCLVVGSPDIIEALEQNRPIVH